MNTNGRVTTPSLYELGVTLDFPAVHDGQPGRLYGIRQACLAGADPAAPPVPEPPLNLPATSGDSNWYTRKPPSLEG